MFFVLYVSTHIMLQMYWYLLFNVYFIYLVYRSYRILVGLHLTYDCDDTKVTDVKFQYKNSPMQFFFHFFALICRIH